MRKALITPSPIYTFLSYCNASTLKKEILDCGAGGSRPPLAVFFKHRYKTYGVDLSEKQVDLAAQFSRNHNMDLDIVLGDMRDLPFKDSAMSFVYSYGSICHMTKKDVTLAMGEIERVLKSKGLCYMNFLSIEDDKFGHGQELGPGESLCKDEESSGLHSFYKEGEPDAYFRNFRILQTERRRTKRYKEMRESIWGELDYIAQKL